MTYKITRVERDGTRIMVAYTDDMCEIGCIIDEDRDKYDSEAVYEVVRE